MTQLHTSKKDAHGSSEVQVMSDKTRSKNNSNGYVLDSEMEMVGGVDASNGDAGGGIRLDGGANEAYAGVILSCDIALLVYSVNC